MSIIGYARVSTLDQDHTSQIKRLNGYGCEKVFNEKKSGTSKEGRAALAECIEYMREGDTLVIVKIDRLARLNQADWDTLKRMLLEKNLG